MSFRFAEGPALAVLALARTRDGNGPPAIGILLDAHRQ